jgi:hypothetical protein
MAVNCEKIKASFLNGLFLTHWKGNMSSPFGNAVYIMELVKEHNEHKVTDLWLNLYLFMFMT